MIFLSRYLMAVIVWGWMLKTFFRWYVVRLFKKSVDLPLQRERETPTHWLGYFERNRQKFYQASLFLLFVVSTDPTAAHRSISFLKEHSRRRRLGWRAMRKTLLIYIQHYIDKHPDQSGHKYALQRISKQLRSIKTDPNSPDVNPPTYSEMPPLGGVDIRTIPQSQVDFFQAVTEGRITDIKKALSEGIPPNIRDESLETPLMVAVLKKNYDIAELLVASGADVNAMDRLEFTPLYCAVGSGQEEMTRMLLHAGANPDQKEGICLSTPLLVAINMNYERIAKMLVDGGADLWSEDLFGEHALSISMRDEHLTMLDYLLSKGIDVNQRDNRMGPLLHSAVARSSHRAITRLIDEGANVNGQNDWGLTPLMFAAWQGDEKLVKLFLDAGADTSLKDHNGLTALDRAKTDEVKRLLQEQTTPRV